MVFTVCFYSRRAKNLTKVIRTTLAAQTFPKAEILAVDLAEIPRSVCSSFPISGLGGGVGRGGFL